MSLACFNLKQLHGLALTFMTLKLLKIISSYFEEWASVWIYLMFPYYLILVVHLWQNIIKIEIMMYFSHSMRKWQAHNLISPITDDINIDLLTEKVSDDSTVELLFFLL